MTRLFLWLVHRAPRDIPWVQKFSARWEHCTFSSFVLLYEMIKMPSRYKSQMHIFGAAKGHFVFWALSNNGAKSTLAGDTDRGERERERESGNLRNCSQDATKPRKWRCIFLSPHYASFSLYIYALFLLSILYLYSIFAWPPLEQSPTKGIVFLFIVSIYVFCFLLSVFLVCFEVLFFSLFFVNI